MNVNHHFLETLNQLGRRRMPVERVYARMLDEELFLAAYGRLYDNKGAMTPGVDPADTIDGMSLKRIRDILTRLRENDWHWKPVRHTFIPKRNGGQRPLGIPSWSDKLVQEVMRMVLQAYYEPHFLDESHGFRPERSCHTALAQVKSRWTGVVWFVEGDIQGCFENIEHERLLGLLGQRIRDFRFLKLVRSMLRAGYWAEGQTTTSASGTPQGGIVSPLLANIFLHELDTYVCQTLKPDFDRGERRAKNPEYRRLNDRIRAAKRRGQPEQALTLWKSRRNIRCTDAFDPNFRRLLYVRYADDFLIGVVGSKAEAQHIKEQVGEKLASLGLMLSTSKTHITHAADAARFLSYDIYVRNRLDDRHLNGTVLLSVPKAKVYELKRRYCKDGRGARRTPYLEAAADETILQYDLELRGYYQYYKLAHNVGSRIGTVKSAMWWSLMHTLAAKHKSTVREQARRLKMVGADTGLSCIGITVTSDTGKQRLITFGNFSLRWSKQAAQYPDRDRYQPMLNTRELTHRLKHDVCELCGWQGETEVHHIRRMKDVRQRYQRGELPYWKLVMASRNRKTLVVCRGCHAEIHGSDGQPESRMR